MSLKKLVPLSSQITQHARQDLVRRLDDYAERQTVSMLGQICADNQLIALRLRRQLPDTGNTSVECTQAGRLLQVELSVRPTPNPNFRRVDARVLEQGAYVLQVSTVMGRN